MLQETQPRPLGKLATAFGSLALAASAIVAACGGNEEPRGARVEPILPPQPSPTRELPSPTPIPTFTATPEPTPIPQPREYVGQFDGGRVQFVLTPDGKKLGYIQIRFADPVLCASSSGQRPAGAPPLYKPGYVYEMGYSDIVVGLYEISPEKSFTIEEKTRDVSTVVSGRIREDTIVGNFTQVCYGKTHANVTFEALRQ